MTGWWRLAERAVVALERAAVAHEEAVVIIRRNADTNTQGVEHNIRRDEIAMRQNDEMLALRRAELDAWIDESVRRAGGAR